MGEIFNITHETGDLSQYSSTTDPDSDLSASNAAAQCGSYGLAVIKDDNTICYARRNYTQFTTSYRFRIYIDPNGLTMNSGDNFTFCNILLGGAERCELRLRYDGASYEIAASVTDDNSTLTQTSYYDITDAPHYVEVRVVKAASTSSNDGTLDLWIDGVHKQQLSGLDIFTTINPDSARVGLVSRLDAGTSGTFYLDDFILRDDTTEIGACSGGSGVVAGPLVNSLRLKSLVGGSLV